LSRIPTIGRFNSGIPHNAKELKKYQPIATKLNTTPENLVSQFRQRVDSTLWRFDNFLLAKVIASNLQATRPDITADTLISGLYHRKSFTRTLRNSGFSLTEAEALVKNAKQEIKESKR
jgi:hypothetical protein